MRRRRRGSEHSRAFLLVRRVELMLLVRFELGLSVVELTGVVSRDGRDRDGGSVRFDGRNGRVDARAWLEDMRGEEVGY